jgi:hypothetical protein
MATFLSNRPKNGHRNSCGPIHDLLLVAQGFARRGLVPRDAGTTDDPGLCSQCCRRHCPSRLCRISRGPCTGGWRRDGRAWTQRRPTGRCAGRCSSALPARRWLSPQLGHETPKVYRHARPSLFAEPSARSGIVVATGPDTEAPRSARLPGAEARRAALRREVACRPKPPHWSRSPGRDEARSADADQPAVELCTTT